MTDNDKTANLAELYAGLAMRAAATDDPEAKACYGLILDMLPKIFDAFDAFAAATEGGATEEARLEKFILKVFPHALAHCAVFLLTSTTPNYYFADAAMKISDAFDDVFMKFVEDVLGVDSGNEPPQ